MAGHTSMLILCHACVLCFATNNKNLINKKERETHFMFLISYLFFFLFTKNLIMMPAVTEMILVGINLITNIFISFQFKICFYDFD